MNKVTPILVTALLVAAGSAASPKATNSNGADAKSNASTTSETKKKDVKHTAPHWTYGNDETGPANWGALSDDFILAEIGSSQSPVDIESKEAVKGEAPELSFTPGEATVDVVNNGHTIVFNCAGAGTLKVAGETFELLQFHYHAPSEHTIDGKNRDVEIHFVHKNDRGQLAVVGVMLKSGKDENETYAEICNRLPAYAGDRLVNESITFSPYDLFPEKNTYFAYPGSLTTPPCSEGVHWFVLTEPVTLSKGQIKEFTDRYTGNNRPVQPLNARLVIVNDD